MPGHAPLDHRALDQVVAPLGKSRTLPADAYTSPEVFEWEQSQLFASTWVCPGRLDDLVAAGQVRAVDGLLVPTAPVRAGWAYSRPTGPS